MTLVPGKTRTPLEAADQLEAEAERLGDPEMADRAQRLRAYGLRKQGLLSQCGEERGWLGVRDSLFWLIMLWLAVVLFLAVFSPALGAGIVLLSLVVGAVRATFGGDR